MERVYVAGVYSYVPSGKNAAMSIFSNMKAGINAAIEIWRLGYAPFCPWLDYHYSLMSDDPYFPEVGNFYAMSLAWLEVSDYLVVLPKDIEHSFGVQLEIDHAIEMGIPIFIGLHEFVAFAKAQDRANRLLKGAMGNGPRSISPSRQGEAPELGDLPTEQPVSQDDNDSAKDEKYSPQLNFD